MHNARFLSNKKVVFAISLALVFPMGCDKEKDAREHLEKGVKYLNKGEYEKAALELKTSGQSKKDVAETYYYLAIVEEKKRNFRAMKENLVKVVELAPTNAEARLKLARVLLLLNEVDAADEQVKIIAKNAGHDPDVEALKASVLLGQKKQPEAVIILDDALKENPDNARLLALKALIFLENKDFKKALPLIDAAIKIDPKNIAMHLARIDLHSKLKDKNAVVSDYLSLISNYPDNQAFKVMLVAQYTKVGKSKEAEELLRAMVVKSPEDVAPKLILLDFLDSVSQEKALEEFHSLKERHKNQPGMLVDLANWVATKRNFKESNAVLNRVIGMEKNSNVGLAAKTLLAKNAFDDKDFDNAGKFVNEILEANSAYVEAKVVRAKLFMVKKQYDEAIKLLSEVSWSKPDSDEVLLLLGQASMDKGDEVEADKYFAKALAANPANLNALWHVYQKALKANDMQYAKQIVQKALTKQPTNIVLLQQLAKIHLSTKNWGQAETISETIANVANPLAEDLASHLDAQIFQGKADYSKAIAIYKKLLLKYPQNRDVLLGLVECYERTNNRGEMVIILNDLLLKNPKNISAAMLLANLYLADKKYDKASGFLSGLIKETPGNTQAHLLLAQAKLAQKDSKGAIEVLQRALKQNPYHIQLSLLLASLYEAQNDYDAALPIYGGLVNKYPDLDIAVNNMASLLTDHYGSKEKLDDAVKLAEKFKDSDQPYLQDTYAWALVKQGRVKEGVGVLTKVVANAPDVAIFAYHLGMAHYKNGDNISAISTLKQAVQLAKQNGLVAEQKAAEVLLKEIVDKNSNL